MNMGFYLYEAVSVLLWDMGGESDPPEICLNEAGNAYSKT